MRALLGPSACDVVLVLAALDFGLPEKPDGFASLAAVVNFFTLKPY